MPFSSVMVTVTRSPSRSMLTSMSDSPCCRCFLDVSILPRRKRKSKESTLLPSASGPTFLIMPNSESRQSNTGPGEAQICISGVHSGVLTARRQSTGRECPPASLKCSTALCGDSPRARLSEDREFRCRQAGLRCRSATTENPHGHRSTRSASRRLRSWTFIWHP